MSKELLKQAKATGMPGVPDLPERKELVLDVAEDQVQAQVANDLGVIDFADPGKSALGLCQSAQVQTAADAHIAQILGVSRLDEGEVSALNLQVRSMGLDTQKACVMMNEVMDRRVRELGAGAHGNAELRDKMVNLRLLTDKINPGGKGFSIGGFIRFLKIFLPDKLVDPAARFMVGYERNSTMMNEILKNLEAGEQRLQNNNTTIISEQVTIRKLTIRLMYVAALGMELEKRLEAKVESMPEGDDKKFLQKEVLFHLNQRVSSIIKQLVVNQQGYLSMEMARQANEQLMRAVSDTQTITVSALSIAIFLALILYDQKLTLDVVEALDQQANELIRQNAIMLRQNLKDIMERVINGGVQFDALEFALNEVKGTIEDYDTIRINALPKQKEMNTKLFGLAQDAEASMQELERGNLAKEQMIDFTEGDLAELVA